MSDHKVILSPRSKERALYMLEQNKLEFYVARTASKLDIKGAVRSLFQVYSFITIPIWIISFLNIIIF